MVRTLKAKNHKEFIEKIWNFSNNHRLIDSSDDWILNYQSPYSQGLVENGMPIEILFKSHGSGVTAYWTWTWRPLTKKW